LEANLEQLQGVNKKESEIVLKMSEETKVEQTIEERIKAGENVNVMEELGIGKVESAHVKSQFELDNLWFFFGKSLKDDKSILIEHYLRGYDELYKFLNLLGTVFGWVATDVYAKMEVVRGHQDGENGDKYLTVQSMLQYEIDNKLIKPKAKDTNTGTRNLLRLHRALEYIIAFLEGVPDLENDEKCCPLSQEAYKKTLMKYHPWVVQKAANLAMHMLPTKGGLIEKICDFDDVEALKKATETLRKSVAAMKKVYEVTQECYAEKDLLGLP